MIDCALRSLEELSPNFSCVQSTTAVVRFGALRRQHSSQHKNTATSRRPEKACRAGVHTMRHMLQVVTKQAVMKPASFSWDECTNECTTFSSAAAAAAFTKLANEAFFGCEWAKPPGPR